MEAFFSKTKLIGGREIKESYQNPTDLVTPMYVGFFFKAIILGHRRLAVGRRIMTLSEMHYYTVQ